MMATGIPQQPTPLSSSSHKRKRGAADQESGRNVKPPTANGDNSNNADFPSDAVQQMLQSIGETHVPDDNTRTAQAALATPMTQNTYPEPGTFDDTPNMPTNYEDGTSPGAPNSIGSTAQAYHQARQQTMGNNKPQVGSQEWQQQRKDNHKEVERRRREVINEGIENIAKIVPNVEKNKGAILQRTCQYIGELQNKERLFETERATLDNAVRELTSRADRFKEAAQKAWLDAHKWQQRCRDAGLHFDDYDDGGLADLGDGEDGVEEP